MLQLPETRSGTPWANELCDVLKERKNPALLNASRRKRIAAGSGTTVTALNTMLNQFFQMQQVMKKMGKMQKLMSRMGGGLPGMFGRR